jgi:hypothetical protein
MVGTSGTDDCVMAEWFLEFNLPRLWQPAGNPSKQRRPSWLHRRAS